MAEPVKLYKDDKEITLYAPSEVDRHKGEGWSITKVVVEEPKPVVVAEPKKRGRPRKLNNA